MSQRLLFRSYAEVCLRAAEVSDSPEQKALSRQAPGNRRSNATPPPMPWLRSCASSLPTCGNKETTGKTRPPTGSAKRRTCCHHRNRLRNKRQLRKTHPQPGLQQQATA